MENKEYAVSLDLTVEAPDKNTAWEYANALGAHLSVAFDGCKKYTPCPDIKKFAGCSVECGNVSGADEIKYDTPEADKPEEYE